MVLLRLLLRSLFFLFDVDACGAQESDPLVQLPHEVVESEIATRRRVVVLGLSPKTSAEMHEAGVQDFSDNVATIEFVGVGRRVDDRLGFSQFRL